MTRRGRSRGVRVLHRPAAHRSDAAFREAVPKPRWAMGTSVLDVEPGELVIARQFAWPYPRQLDDDLARQGARALNDARAFAFCDDVIAYSDALGTLAPKAWGEFCALPPEQPVVLKGLHADKSRWSRMFAMNREAAIKLRSELWRDTGMADQPIVAREFVPLAQLGESVTGGCPPCEEWRVFVLDGRIVGEAPYWPPDDCTRPCPELAGIPGSRSFIDSAVSAVRAACPSLRWIALDLGRTTSGRLYVVEVSDGQRAGIPDAMTPEATAAMLTRMADIIDGRP